MNLYIEKTDEEDYNVFLLLSDAFLHYSLKAQITKSASIHLGYQPELSFPFFTVDVAAKMFLERNNERENTFLYEKMINIFHSDNKGLDLSECIARERQKSNASRTLQAWKDMITKYKSNIKK